MTNQTKGFRASFSLEQCLAAYEEVVARFGFAPVCNPGRIDILGWDLEYVCGSALASFIDSLLIRRLNDFIPDNDRPLILDCGANIGFSVLNYKRQFPDSTIIAFEPDPQFAPVLKRNLERNGITGVEVVESAVWIKNGEAKWLCEGIDGSRLIESKNNNSDTIVRTIDLRDYMNRHIDLLKVDIEGVEYDVIPHLGNRLGRVKNILIECHVNQEQISGFSGILRILKEVGFNIGINSFGPWRDLIRQTEILPNHWGQYLAVAGWRGEIPGAEKEYTSLPYVGKELSYVEVKLRQAADALRQYQRLNAAPFNGASLILKGRFVRDSLNCWKFDLSKYMSFGDNEIIQSSPLKLFEDGRELGPPHAVHDDIRNRGEGRYSHWKENLYFSTTDNSDPNENGRRYRVVIGSSE